MDFVNYKGYVFFANMTFSLKHIKREPLVKTSERPPMLILLHGLGSNEHDLFAFVPHLDPEFLVLSVQAPVSYGFGGYAWFNIDLTSGVPNANIQQVVQARRLITSFIDEAIEAYQPDTSRIMLAGFSQGAIIGYATAFAEPEKVSALVAMSGYILKDIAPQIFSPALKNLKIMATHGINDQVLPIFLGRSSEAFLKSMQLDHIYKEYLMAHEVNYECFNDIKHWLSAQIKKSK